ncbi:hypothetical protein [Baekduia sp. Peel2402]|uniref:hypothetical protein n=1 Tax=Baekduia sp. Peel2402 TaxID=3458296 RepID=UPI00403E64A3
MLSPRVLLLALIVAASATFVLGVTLERSGETDHHETTSASSAHREQTESDGHAEGGEGATEDASESAGTARATADADADHELRPLGIDIEAWPFVIAAVLASLALALAGWQRSHHTNLLALVAVVMLAFGALDAREVAHQIDIDKNGLAILAALVAVMHLAAAAVAASMARGAHRSQNGLGGRADTMAA